MRPSEALSQNRREVLDVLGRYPISRARVFGSVARGEDTENSDLDILIETSETMSLFDLARIEIELERVLELDVDVMTIGFLAEHMHTRIESEARAI